MGTGGENQIKKTGLAKKGMLQSIPVVTKSDAFSRLENKLSLDSERTGNK